MKWDVVNNQGQKVESVELSQDGFGLEMNEPLLHSVVKAYRANRRQGTHATKTRAFVSGGGKKPIKQKGTGGARQGSNRSPLMPGGAILHGPQPRCYRQITTQKARLQALAVALSDKIRHKKVVVVDSFGLNSFSTKSVLSMIKKLAPESPRKCLFVDTQNEFLYRSTRNLPYCEALEASGVNAESILKHEICFVSREALKQLEQRLGK